MDFEDTFEPQACDAVEKALAEIAPVDYKYVMAHSHPKIRQRIYHLAGSSEYRIIDFCWQLHSRPKEEYQYINNNVVESAKVLFDKDGIIRFKDYNPAEFKSANDTRLEECKYRYSQHLRVRKYVLRNQYPEAYAYYNRYVLKPLIDILRILYTPANADYYLIHISRHLPSDEVKKLEYFVRLTSVQDIAVRIFQAEEWFQELVKRLEDI